MEGLERIEFRLNLVAKRLPHLVPRGKELAHQLEQEPSVENIKAARDFFSDLEYLGQETTSLLSDLGDEISPELFE